MAVLLGWTIVELIVLSVPEWCNSSSYDDFFERLWVRVLSLLLFLLVLCCVRWESCNTDTHRKEWLAIPAGISSSSCVLWWYLHLQSLLFGFYKNTPTIPRGWRCWSRLGGRLPISPPAQVLCIFQLFAWPLSRPFLNTRAFSLVHRLSRTCTICNLRLERRLSMLST